MMENKHSKLPDLLLEQYALGELSASDRQRVETALAEDPLLKARLEALKSSDAEILESYQPAEIAQAVRRRMLTATESQPENRGFLGFLRGTSLRGTEVGGLRLKKPGALVLTAAAVAFLAVGFAMTHNLFWTPSADDITRAKGAVPGLLIYKKTAEGPVVLADGDKAAQGDVLQLRYGAGTESYGAIVSLDGRGTITWHLPPSGAAMMPGMPSSKTAAPLDAAGSLLGSAYELDDAPSFERFFIFSSNSSFDLAKISASLRVLALSGKAASGTPSLPAGIEWRSLRLDKPGESSDE